MLNIWEIINNKDKNYYKKLAKKHVVRWYLIFLLLSLTIIISWTPDFLKLFKSLKLSDIINYILLIFYILFLFWLPFLWSLYLGIRVFKYKWNEGFKLYFKSILVLLLFLPLLFFPLITFWRNVGYLSEWLLIIYSIYASISLIFFIISYNLINKPEIKTALYNKMYSFVFWIALLFFILNSWHYVYEYSNMWNITSKYEYRYSECIESGENPSIKRVYWDGVNIIVKAKISMNCWVKTQRWIVDIENWKIILNINSKITNWFYLCICDFDSSFKIKNVVKEDYKIVLNVNNFEIDNLTFLKNWEIKDQKK